MKVLEYCEHHCYDPPANDTSSISDSGRRRTTEIGEWDQKFITVDQEMLFEIILAANYLQIKPLLSVHLWIHSLYVAYLNLIGMSAARQLPI